MQACPPRVERTPLHLTGPGRCRSWREVASAGLRDLLVQLRHRRLLTGTDVHHEATPATRVACEGVDDIVHVHVIAGLAAVAEDDARPPGDEIAGEDRDDARSEEPRVGKEGR